MKNLGIRMIVPSSSVVVEVWNQNLPTDVFTGLFVEEEQALGNVSLKRRADFVLGRTCAREALRELGLQPATILCGPSREPIWPTGVCGSITHCDGYAASVVARQSEIRSIGIDAERRRQLAPGVLKMVATPSEMDWISREGSDLPWDLILFSAKESVFKTWFPVAGTWLGFEEAEVNFDLDSKRFRARLSPADGHCSEIPREVPREICGRYHAGESHVFTCAFIAEEKTVRH